MYSPPYLAVDLSYFHRMLTLHRKLVDELGSWWSENHAESAERYRDCLRCRNFKAG